MLIRIDIAAFMCKVHRRVRFPVFPDTIRYLADEVTFVLSLCPTLRADYGMKFNPISTPPARRGWAAKAGSQSSPLQRWVARQHEFESNAHGESILWAGGEGQWNNVQGGVKRESVCWGDPTQDGPAGPSRKGGAEHRPTTYQSSIRIDDPHFTQSQYKEGMKGFTLLGSRIPYSRALPERYALSTSCPAACTLCKSSMSLARGGCAINA